MDQTEAKAAEESERATRIAEDMHLVNLNDGHIAVFASFLSPVA